MSLIGQTVLDRYVVEEELGRGAMGTVYRGRHAKLRRHVAIKVMHEHLTGEPVLRERFLREGRAASKLHHKNVVAVLDVGDMPDGKPVLVMEYAAGVPLSSIMTGPLDARRFVPLLEQILRGLDHAHAAGLVHRDLKPDNVIITRDDSGDEVLRIVDFGVAILRAPDEGIEGMRLTTSGAMVGTPLYMAPEQARGERVDHRADLYAIGSIMYEMIAGATPFTGTAIEIALAKIDNDPPPLASRAPSVRVDRVLEAFMKKLLARDPAGRPATAQDALDLLELYDRDRLAAATALGVIDVDAALATIALGPLR